MSSTRKSYVFQKVDFDNGNLVVEDNEGTLVVDRADVTQLNSLFSDFVLPLFVDGWNVEEFTQALEFIHRFNRLDHSDETREKVSIAIANFKFAAVKSASSTNDLHEPSHLVSSTNYDSGVTVAKSSIEYALGAVVKDFFIKPFHLNTYLSWILHLHTNEDIYRQLHAPDLAEALSLISIALIRVIRVGNILKNGGTPSDRTPNYHDFSWRAVAQELDPNILTEIKNKFPDLGRVVETFHFAAIIDGMVEYCGGLDGLKRAAPAIDEGGWDLYVGAGLAIGARAVIRKE